MTEFKRIVAEARKLNDEFETNTLGKREPVIDELVEALEQAVTDLEEIQYFIGLARSLFINSDMRGDPAVEMEAVLASIHEPMHFHRAITRAKMIAMDDLLSTLSPGRVSILTETVERARDKYAREALKEVS